MIGEHLTQPGRRGIRTVPTEKSRKGCGRAPALFGSNVDELLSPAAQRQNQMGD